MLTTRRVVAAKVEAVEGIGETITVADGGILAIDPKVDVDIKINERNPVMATMSKLASVAGSRLAKLTFRAELKGAGAPYSATVKPALSQYLRACGFAETLDTTAGAEKVVYRPTSTGIPTLTIECYEDGVVKRIIGARGSAKFSGKVGEVVYVDFEFTGVWDGIRDGAMIQPTYESTVPPSLLNGSFSIAGYQPVISYFEIDLANVLYLREDINSPAGYKSAIITERKPAGRFDPEMTLVADHDWFGRWQAGAAGSLSLGPIGADQYNRMYITAPKVLYKKVTDGVRNSIAVADTEFQLAMNSGDDELTVEFS